MQSYVIKCLIAVVLINVLPALSKASEPIKVGIFNNKPIVYYENNLAKGLFVEVLDYTAGKENWDIEYIYCEVGDCLKLLKNNELNLVASLGDSVERLKHYTFSKEPVWTFWGTIYSIDRSINSILDLTGKKIAVRKNNKTTAALKKLLEDFEVKAECIEYDNYESAFAALNKDEADTIAVNNSYAFSKTKGQSHLYKTPIVFNPFSAYFAASKKKENEYLLNAIDSRLRELKTDPDSVYYSFIDKWYGVSGSGYWTPQKIFLFSGCFLVLVIVVMMIWRYKSIVSLNKELQMNIKEREEIQEQLVDQMKLLQKSQEIGKIGTWSLYIERDELIWTDENYKIFGIPKSTKLTYERFLECVHPEDREYVHHKWEEAFNRKPYDIEHRLVVDGDVKWVREKAELEFDESGKCVKGTGFTQDISDAKHAENEKKILEKQLLQAQKLESIGRLAGGIAHDLNNLLSPIIGYSEMLLENPKFESQEKSEIEQINQAGLKASNLVRQLLAFSRKQVLDYKLLNLNDVIAGFEKLLRRTIREDIDINFIKTPELSLINADAGQVEQVLMNLSVNASDAMQNGGILTIETKNVNLDEQYTKDKISVREGEYIMLAISDSGHGMDDETCANVFEPFFTTKAEHGTGLGLATVYGIVKQHGGNIWVYSEVDKGTTFKIYFPVPAANQSSADEAIFPKAVSLGGTETILLAEDHDQVRGVTKQMLIKNGYNVLAATSGVHAIDLFSDSNTEIDLLLTDVVMPKMNGKELYSILAERFSGLKVIYMSGYTDNVIVHHGVLDEGIDFIQKPFAANDLLISIRESLDR